MKKRFLAIAIAVLLGILSSCGGLRDDARITVKDPVSDKFLDFALQVKAAAYSGVLMTFSIDKSPAALLQILKDGQNNYAVELYDNQWILLQDADSSFLAGEIEKESGSPQNAFRYAICSPVGSFVTGSPGASQLVQMYMPYHLLEIESFSDVFSRNDFSGDHVTYKAVGDQEAFYRFYAGFQRYDVRNEDDSVLVSDHKSGHQMSVVFANGTATFQIIPA